MSETWVDEKGWERIKDNLLKGYIWGKQLAKGRDRKGRAMGGMAMGIRKELMEKGQEIKLERERSMEGRVRVARERWRIIGVYVQGNMKEVLKDMEEWMEEKEVRCRVMIGDFNARTGREGGAVRKEEKGGSGGEKRRNSKDDKINKDGKKLVEVG